MLKWYSLEEEKKTKNLKKRGRFKIFVISYNPNKEERNLKYEKKKKKLVCLISYTPID